MKTIIEMDFFIRYDDCAVAIEVKSADNIITIVVSGNKIREIVFF